ncbi:MAG: hypothetical protein JSV14_10015 [Deltaproteobacteria bacterium]|nr:MAG: hypothetical protein JSV14_10015 [Deltaproteobacteria bacterium]
MKVSQEELINRAEKAIRACLDGVPFLKIKEVSKERLKGTAQTDLLIQPDLLIQVVSPSGTRNLIFEAKTSGQPRLAREAIYQMLRYREAMPNAYGVFLAPYVSPKTAQICADEGVGYVDLSGNCRLCFGEVYIEKAGRPNKFTEKRGLRSLFSPKATRILRVLLNDPKVAWKVAKLAEESDVSLGQVTKVKKLLADREWIRKVAQGIELSDPRELLAEWTENYTYRANEVLDYYSMQTISEIEASLASVCGGRRVDYALTGFSGAARFAPAVRFQRLMAYVSGITEEIETDLKLKRVTTGANVSLLIPYDEGVYYGAKVFEGVRVVSPIQLYLDLKGYRGRGEEAAEALLERVILPSW